MYEYLAYTAAVSGGFKEALQADKVSGAMLDSAGDIIEALLNGGPAEDLSDYKDAAIVIDLYISHLVKAGQLKIVHFNILKAIEDYLEDDELEWEKLAENGWTPEKRHIVLERAKGITDDSSWKTTVTKGLSTNDNQQFWEIKRAARYLDIDLWPTISKRINANPEDTMLWFDVMQLVTDKDISSIIELAEKTIPLLTISTGPANEMGLGEKYKYHQILDTILQDLGKFPGHGTRLIETGLQSPVIRNRVMAIRAIEDWGIQHTSDEILRVLETTSRLEPDQEIKEDMRRMLANVQSQ
ncbi:hypothetical protein [Alteromonas sp. KUL49]|uniref:hypothetical protein n=1 Tax=Alteromonas sp. KUL49 TaxID=2480798 RepID=UPI00102EE8D1|nr:hypothetical protein [Alteromonas sp. KUL49]TAP40846.1 hypothetical protein EYS00_06965 [Alteromonas sp. KUL49]GEA11023.1 hypothetical protein KUL49_13980 [Alteromonas sp. KUL49]